VLFVGGGVLLDAGGVTLGDGRASAWCTRPEPPHPPIATRAATDAAQRGARRSMTLQMIGPARSRAEAGGFRSPSIICTIRLSMARPSVAIEPLYAATGAARLHHLIPRLSWPRATRCECTEINRLGNLVSVTARMSTQMRQRSKPSEVASAGSGRILRSGAGERAPAARRHRRRGTPCGSRQPAISGDRSISRAVIRTGRARTSRCCRAPLGRRRSSRRRSGRCSRPSARRSAWSGWR
jgi:hypothetical protein